MRWQTKVRKLINKHVFGVKSKAGRPKQVQQSTQIVQYVPEQSQPEYQSINLRGVNTMKATVIMLITIFASLGLLVWWMEDRFGATAALVALSFIGATVIIFVTQLFSLAQQKAVMQSFVDNNQNDAMVDRYRQQTLLEGQRMARIGMQQDTLALKDSLRQQRQLPDMNQRAQSYIEPEYEDVDYGVYQ